MERAVVLDVSCWRACGRGSQCAAGYTSGVFDVAMPGIPRRASDYWHKDGRVYVYQCRAGVRGEGRCYQGGVQGQGGDSKANGWMHKEAGF